MKKEHWRWFSMSSSNPFSRVPETNPNEALESLNEDSSEEVVEEWLKQENLDIGTEEYTEAVSRGEDRTVAIPRFFGARNLEQTALYAFMSALDAASREIYGEGFDLKVLPWDDGFNPQVPGNRILAEPAVLVSEDKVQEIGLDEDTQKRMDNLDVEQVRSNGYLLNFRNFGEFNQNSAMEAIGTSIDSGEPAFLAKALGLPYSEVEKPLDYFRKSSPLPETGMQQDQHQKEVLELLFGEGVYPTSLNLKQNGTVEEVKRSNGNYRSEETEDIVSETEILNDGMMTASENYGFLVGPQNQSGLNYIWNGGWPKSSKFRPSEAENVLKIAENQENPVRIPSIGDFKNCVPSRLREPALQADFSNCAETDYEKGEAVGSLLISDEVVYSDLVADYAGDIVRAEEEPGYEPDTIPEFSQKILSRIGETYGVT
jgi:hypothetical protein